MTDGMAMQLMIPMEVWRYNGRQRDGRDEAFVGGGSGSKSNSILLVVRDSTPDCHHAIACDRKRSHAISKINLSFTTVRVLGNASGMRSGTESLPKVFLHDRFHLGKILKIYTQLKSGFLFATP
jgi:hypothetical protein